jgi:DNA-binding NarL/FixJ family response regulator
MIRVLVVDDHTLLRRGLVLLLQGERDLEVVAEASDGEEAVKLARELEPDVVVMDVSMPGMAGTEATRRIKEEMPDVRVVGLSMHDLDGTRETMLKAGADTYMVKDSPTDDLLAAIRGKNGS